MTNEPTEARPEAAAPEAPAAPEAAAPAMAPGAGVSTTAPGAPGAPTGAPPAGGPRFGPRREGGPGGPGGRRRGRFVPHRKVCSFCVEKVTSIDYKDPGRIRRYLSERGKIEPRRKTGTCAHHQRQLTEALKRARHLALLPYTAEHIRLTGVFAPRQ